MSYGSHNISDMPERTSHFSSQPLRRIVMRHSAYADSTSVWGVCFLAVCFLAFAHLTIKGVFPNPAFWFVGAGAIVATGSWFLIARHDTWGFLLAVFVCAHFAFAADQGGLWAYVLCALLLTAIVLKYRPGFRIASVPKGINALVLIFLAHQLIGLLLNPYSLVSNIQSLVVTGAQLVAFYGCASLSMSETRFKRLLKVWFLVGGIRKNYTWRGCGRC